MTLSHLTDFPDRISPMLVKELRQGLRAKTFIAVFLSLQVFLGIMLLSASATSASDRAGSVVSGMIFTFFSIAVLVVQPIRGVAALSSEIKGNTIDMMVLTRLSAWRIVFGKWVALVSQSALILSTIIPYLILRYFFGGMNLVGEIVLLALIFLTSMALTAVTVGLSGSSSAVIRAIIPLFGTPLLFIGLISFMFDRSGRQLIETCSLDSQESLISVCIYVLVITYLGGSALSLGASLIAPAAENHSSLRRIVALTGMLGMLAAMYFSTIEKGLSLMLISLIATPAILIALTESALLVPTVCRPFVKRGALGKAVGHFLYPGLASGIVFTILIAAVGIIACLIDPDISASDELYAAILGYLGALLFPAVIQAFFFRGDGQRVANYLLLMIGSGIMTGILSALTEAMSNRDFLWLFVWNPTVLMAMVGMGRFDRNALLIASIAINLIFVTILLIKALSFLKGNREIIRQSEEELDASSVQSKP
ncbi:MAG: hypothetical protein ABI600_13170 [Luteolibacter sp.]